MEAVEAMGPFSRNRQIVGGGGFLYLGLRLVGRSNTDPEKNKRHKC